MTESVVYCLKEFNKQNINEFHWNYTKPLFYTIRISGYGLKGKRLCKAFQDYALNKTFLTADFGF
jgi:hypothetical protein